MNFLVKGTEVTANSYSMMKALLGSKIFSELKIILKNKLDSFIKLYDAYDKISQEYPDLDPSVTVFTNTPIFTDLDSYINYIYKLNKAVSVLHSKAGKNLAKITEAMKILLDTGLKNNKDELERVQACVVDQYDEDVVASVNESYFNNAKEGYSSSTAFPNDSHASSNRLTWVNMLSIPNIDIGYEDLPNIYPSYEATKKAVLDLYKMNNYEEKIFRSLSKIVSCQLSDLNLNNTWSGKSNKKGYLYYIIYLQTYLYENRWLNPNYDELQEAKFYINKYYDPHERKLHDTTMRERISYEYIGICLEKELRKIITHMANEVMSSSVFVGKQIAVDMILGCCTEVVRNCAIKWFNKMYKYFVEYSSNHMSQKTLVKISRDKFTGNTVFNDVANAEHRKNNLIEKP